jgi:cytochrome c biogenesis factor
LLVKKIITELLGLLRELAKLEAKTEAGRHNFAVMIASLLFVALTTASPILEAFVRIFKDNYSTGLPWLQVFMGWAILNLACVLLLGTLEVWTRRGGR